MYQREIHEDEMNKKITGFRINFLDFKFRTEIVATDF